MSNISSTKICFVIATRFLRNSNKGELKRKTLGGKSCKSGNVADCNAECLNFGRQKGEKTSNEQQRLGTGDLSSNTRWHRAVRASLALNSDTAFSTVTIRSVGICCGAHFSRQAWGQILSESLQITVRKILQKKKKEKTPFFQIK